MCTRPFSKTAKRSGCRRWTDFVGDFVKTVQGIGSGFGRVLLPRANNRVCGAYAGILRLPEEVVVSTGLDPEVDHIWDFERPMPFFELGPVQWAEVM